MRGHRPSAPGLCLGVGTAVLVAVHAIWLRAHRQHGPVDIDEAAYLAPAFAMSDAFSSGNPLTEAWDFWAATTHAPLLATTTVPAQLVFGREIDVSVMANLLFLVLLVASIYGVARTFCSDWWAAAAAGLVALLPGITDFTRTYQFALISTAVFTFTLYALLRSDGMSSSRWALWFGVGLGATALSRTIMVGFAAVLVLAAVASIADRSRQQRAAAWLRLHLALVVGFGVAATWYLYSGSRVWSYLTTSGYGEQSLEYGAPSVWSSRFWLNDIAGVVAYGTFVPLAALLAVGAGLGTWRWWRRRDDHGWRPLLTPTPARLCVLIVGLGFVLLLTSRNDGSGFALPLVPIIVTLAVAAIARLAAPVAVGLLVAAALVSTANHAAANGLWGPVAERRILYANDWVELPLTTGESHIGFYVADVARYGHQDPLTEVPEVHEGWLPAASETVRVFEDQERTHVVMAVDGPMYHQPLLQLALAMDGRDALPIVVVPDAPTDDGRDVRPAVALIDEEVTHVITAPKDLSWGSSGYDQPTFEAALERQGFASIRTIGLPDGRPVTVWSR